MKYCSELRKKAGLTQADLASLAGISRAFLARVETGKSNLSNALDSVLCSICDLDVSLGNKSRPSEVQAQPNTIPVVAMAAAAHYDPALSNLCDLWDCTDERIACACAHADELFGVRVSGDSMAPALMDGDVIAVSETLPSTGDICIALHRTDGILCKRWYWKNGIIRLESINPEGRTYEWTKEAFTAEAPIVWRFRVEALVYRKLS